MAEIDDYKSAVQQSTDIKAMLTEYSRDNFFSITEPGVFTSVGYPYHYFPDQLYIWNITLTDGSYIRLLFSNISLHDYKVNCVFRSAIYVYAMKWRAIRPFLVSLSVSQSTSDIQTSTYFYIITKCLLLDQSFSCILAGSFCPKYSTFIIHGL